MGAETAALIDFAIELSCGSSPNERKRKRKRLRRSTKTKTSSMITATAAAGCHAALGNCSGIRRGKNHPPQRIN
jgi:hypothetical protein